MPTMSAFSSKPHSTHPNRACIWRLSADTWPAAARTGTARVLRRHGNQSPTVPLELVLQLAATGLGRAYNITAPASGRVLAGGVDASALHPAKQFFGAARNIENGGSLTVLATAMADTGSRTDEVILEEFRGTANMELRLSRTIADRRIFPALDIQNSATLHEEMLLSPQEVEVSLQIRRAMDHGDAQRTLQAVLTRMGQSSTNAEFMAREREQPIFQSVQ